MENNEKRESSLESLETSINGWTTSLYEDKEHCETKERILKSLLAEKEYLLKEKGSF